MGIGETLRWALSYIVMRAAGDQAKTACGNPQLCAGIEVGIEGGTHTVGQLMLERVKARQQIGEYTEVSNEEEESGGVAACRNKIIIETVGTEEESAEILEAMQEMEVKLGRGYLVEVDDGVDGTLRSLGAREFLTPNAEPSGTTIVDAHDGFNELSQLEMLWTVRHCGVAGARFAFN